MSRIQSIIKKNMIHLQTHSFYSFLRGVNSPAQLVQAAVENQMPALALTDRNYLTGAIEFYSACHQNGIQPILGLQLAVNFRVPEALVTQFPGQPDPADPIIGKIVLLAMDRSGWSGLCRVSSLLLSLEKPILELDELSAHSQGLLGILTDLPGLLSGRFGIKGKTEQLLSPLVEIFPDRIYAGFHVFPPNHGKLSGEQFIAALRLAGSMKVPCVIAQDIHYIQRDEVSVQALFSAVRENKPLVDLTPSDVALPGSHFIGKPELIHFLSNYPIADPGYWIDRTVEIAARCKCELPLGEPHYPTFSNSESGTPEEILRQKALIGLNSRYTPVTAAIAERLELELNSISSQGYASIFLIMQEIVQFAHKQGIPLSSRGSAASSLVAHCLGITSPDPIKLNLYFERFMNPMRHTPPDIDTDLCSKRRNEVIEFVYNRYGKKNVAMISTINRFRARSALREAAKANGRKPAQISTLVNRLHSYWYRGPGGVSQEDPYTELLADFTNAEDLEILTQARSLIGVPRHLSIHPGGIVIVPGEITDFVPTFLAPKGILVTQFDLRDIERLGILKLDLLGIRGLSVLGDVAMAAATVNVNKYTSPLDIFEQVKEDDFMTADLVRSGKTIGCFQIESPGMRATLLELDAHSQDDIMAALALYRPGPLSGGLKQAFVERYKLFHDNNRSSPQENLDDELYFHLLLKPILMETYGVILYQEQVLRIAHELAGFSLADADLLRRAMSHFDIDRQMDILKRKFIDGAYRNAKVPQQVAERLWQMMAAFAGYGFPKAHAASYSQVAWRSAWSKAHFPEIFIAAVLANWGGYYSQRVYLSEAKRMGLIIKPPMVNYAKLEFSVVNINDQLALVMGLGQVRELTRKTQAKIIRERPFSNLQDFLIRVDPGRVEALNLVRAGALSGFGSPEAQIQVINQGERSSQQLLFILDASQDIILHNEISDWSLAERAAQQEAVLGVCVDVHPVELIPGYPQEFHAITTLQAVQRIGQVVRVIGIRQSWHDHQVPGKDFLTGTVLEDPEGTINLRLPRELSRKYQSVLRSKRPFLVEGVVEKNPSELDVHIRINRINDL